MLRTVFYGWYLVAVAMLLQMLGTGTISYSYSVVVLPLESEFGASRMTMMMGITVMPIAAAAISPLLGRALDTGSLRAVVVFTSMLLPAGFVALSLVNAMWQVPLIYALCMACASLVFGPLGVSTLLARWFRARMGFAMGLAALGTSIGGFVFPPLISWLMEVAGWRAALRIVAAIVFALGFPAALLVVNRPADRMLSAYGSEPGDPSQARSAAPAHGPSVWRQRNFWLVGIVISVVFAVYGALLANFAPFAIESGIAKDRAALLISVIAVCGIIGKLAFGTIADRVDLRAALGGSILLVVSGLSLFLAEGFGTVLGGCVLIGLAAGGLLPVWGAMLAWLFGVASYGRVMGLMNPLIMPMTVIAPPLAGRIYDRTGSYDYAFLVFLLALVLSLLLLPLIRPPGVAAGRGTG